LEIKIEAGLADVMAAGQALATGLLLVVETATSAAQKCFRQPATVATGNAKSPFAPTAVNPYTAITVLALSAMDMKDLSAACNKKINSLLAHQK
jgi:hypothetical protein